MGGKSRESGVKSEKKTGASIAVLGSPNQKGGEGGQLSLQPPENQQKSGRGIPNSSREQKLRGAARSRDRAAPRTPSRVEGLFNRKVSVQQGHTSSVFATPSSEESSRREFGHSPLEAGPTGAATPSRLHWERRGRGGQEIRRVANRASRSCRGWGTSRENRPFNQDLRGSPPPAEVDKQRRPTLCQEFIPAVGRLPHPR